MIENGQKVKAGEVIVKIPRAVGKAGDITGGLPVLLSCLKHVTRRILPSYPKSMERLLWVK